MFTQLVMRTLAFLHLFLRMQLLPGGDAQALAWTSLQWVTGPLSCLLSQLHPCCPIQLVIYHRLAVTDSLPGLLGFPKASTPTWQIVNVHVSSCSSNYSPVPVLDQSMHDGFAAGEDADGSLAEPLMGLRDLAQDRWQTFLDLGPADVRRNNSILCLEQCSLLDKLSVLS